LVAGAGPYEAASPMAVVSKHLSEPVPGLRERAPSASEAFDRIVRRALAKKAAERFQSADEMREALQVLAGGEVRLEAAPASPATTGGYSIASREDWDAFEKSLRRGLWVRNALGPLAVLLALGLAGWFGW